MQGPFDWETEGRRLGAALDHFHAIVVVGDDDGSTAKVAVGVGRAQAVTRRVVVGDLLGGAAPIQALLQHDDPHGLFDSFEYGISLGKVTHEVRGAGRLAVVPSGIGPIDYPRLLADRRWPRLAETFRQTGGLLILAAPSGAPGIERLVAATDGAVLVGDTLPAHVPAARVLRTIREPRPRISARRSGAAVAATVRSWYQRRLVGAGVGVALTLALAGFGVWIAQRPLDHSVARPVTPQADTTRTAAGVVGSGASMVAAGSVTGAGRRGAVAVPANPRDSTRAAAWSVELKSFATQAGAVMELEAQQTILPAATFAPMVEGDMRWFPLIGGAYTDSAGAAELLSTLRQHGMLRTHWGQVKRRPLALMIQAGVGPDTAAAAVSAYIERGLPVYALRQPDGSATLYAGAFETPEQATLLAESLRASGLSPTLVYRTGRVF
ncbi:MAG: hypothetical protein ABR499_07435 [Gemmatimonadaceae bacterium]